jgi:hypothetical protein
MTEQSEKVPFWEEMGLPALVHALTLLSGTHCQK